ncbi:SusC/RagA family TonB-linked outer membrane protein [Spirosoma montaniterrae]|uniref:SusC/RagA family TonB-linked outer membrane protein n=1 Tax=Spirosoma montaniterrae TaxID=1178516 RepID=A0A1P9WV59_9BACT|nr:SusC/RagA family TonB-linked outer membrane protein [Spirosoma montaniterrae]AQG79286.1 SusC/RagA family TonB-linked outer membrane protein [Spirosoma montaniterrae]
MKTCLFLLVLTLPVVALAQQRVVRGRVTDAAEKSALPGTTITVKGGTQGTVTDAQGTYQINVPERNATLVFSSVGFRPQEVVVGNKDVVDVVLTVDTKQLSEVVVTAAGIKRDKNALGYAVTTLDAAKLAQRSEPDPLRALTGKVAGVNVQGSGGAAGGATNITIRGNSSLGNNNQPLFVVDGVPFDNSSFGGTDGTVGGSTITNRAFDLDPNNILTMTVLKGAAAAALYGSRAANGAIIVTTKAGKSQSRKGLEITYNTGYSIETVAGLPEYQTRYGQGTNFDYRSGVFGSWGPPYQGVSSLIPTRATIPHPLTTNNRYPVSVFPEFYQADGRTPVQVPYQSYSQNNAKNFFRTGNVFENALSVSTGGEKGNLTVGLSRTGNQGVVPENEITRTGINIGGNAQLDNKFYVSGSLNYVNTNQVSPQVTAANGAGASIMDILLFVPTSFDLTGFPNTNPLNGNNVYDRVGTDNPYWSVQNSPTTSKVDRYYGNMVLGTDVLPWLNIQNTIGFNAYTDRRVVVNGKGGDYFPNGNVTNDNIYRQEIDNTLLITATKSLSEDFGLKVILGNNVNQRLTERAVVFGDGIIFRGINSLNNTSVTIPRVLPNNRNNFKQRYFAFFTDISLDYKNYAFLNLVARNDVSSTLPASNRSYLYGGASASLIFTEALRLPKNVLSFGKFRAGYTRVGNEATPYQTQTVYIANPVLGAGTGTGAIASPFNGQSTLTESDLLANAELKPEFITELELGAELQFFNNRIGLDITYYNKISTSQIFTVNAAPSTGYTQKVINLGKSSNEGIEIGLSATPVKLPNGFSWDISSAFTLNRNIVLDIGALKELPYGGFSDLGSVHIAGQPYGQIRGSTYARDDEGNILVNPNTGKPILSGRTGPIGNPNPDFILGVTNTLSYKGLTLSALFDWKKGGDMYSFTAYELLSRGVTRDTDEREAILVGPGVLGNVNTLQPILDGEGKKIPNNIGIAVADYYFSGGFGPGGAGEVNVFDATVFRLREVSLGYQLPKKWLSKTPFGMAVLSMSGRNLWYLAPNFPKYLNFDPEVSSLGAGNSQGFDFIGIPTTRRVGVNLRLSF